MFLAYLLEVTLVLVFFFWVFISFAISLSLSYFFTCLFAHLFCILTAEFIIYFHLSLPFLFLFCL